MEVKQTVLILCSTPIKQKNLIHVQDKRQVTFSVPQTNEGAHVMNILALMHEPSCQFRSNHCNMAEHMRANK